MSDVVVTSGGQVALELYEVLRILDRSQWYDITSEVRERLARIQQRGSQLISASVLLPGVLRQRLTEVERSIRESVPDIDGGREAWLAFRARVIPAYEALAAGLRAEAVLVPSLRPTNLSRSAFHIATGVIVIVLIEEALSPPQLILPPALFAGTFWFLEFLRRRSERANDFLMRLFRPIAHPHERHRVNSATWYGTALVAIAFIREPLVCAVAVAVLGMGDPAAAFVGRRWGKTQLLYGRTLEGSLTFFVSATLAAFAMLLVWHRGPGWLALLAIAAVAAAVAALVELLSDRLDDNFTTPLAAAAGAWGTALAFGVLG